MGAALGCRRPLLVAVMKVSRASRSPALAALSAELMQSSRCWGRRPEVPAALLGGKD